MRAESTRSVNLARCSTDARDAGNDGGVFQNIYVCLKLQ